MKKSTVLGLNLILFFLIQSSGWTMSNEDPSSTTSETSQTIPAKRKRGDTSKTKEEEKQAKKARQEAARQRLKQKKEEFEKNFASQNLGYKEKKERKRERQKEYFQRPEVKERLKEYNQKPEVKERRKEYEQKPKVKEYRKEYKQRPEVKERQKEYYQRPEVKERRKEYKQRKKEMLLQKNSGAVSDLQQRIEHIQTSAALSGESAERRPGNALIEAYENQLEIEQLKAPMTPSSAFAVEILADLLNSRRGTNSEGSMDQALDEIYDSTFNEEVPEQDEKEGQFD
jgi:hypothetical protein